MNEYKLKLPTKEDFVLANKFIEQHGGKNFDLVSYRPGASTTDLFGLTDRYKKINNEYVWGYPGIHTGVDRGVSSKTIDDTKNPVIVPFNTSSSCIFDDGGKMYGTIISLFHQEGFVIRICHMRPQEIKVFNELKNLKPLKAGTLIGPAGDYGMTFGIHTHTDVESYFNNNFTETSPFLDAILEIKYGDKVKQELSNEEVFDVYKSCKNTKDWDEEQVFKDYKEVRNWRGISFLNKYKYVWKDYSNNVIYTRYSSKLLFDM